MKTLNSLISPDRAERIFQQIQKAGEDIETADPKFKRQFWWTQICEHILTREYEENKSQTFKKVMGQTRLFTIEELKNIFETAYRWKTNPPALLWKLIREKQAELRAK